MPGVRLHHPTFRAAEGATLTYVVELPMDFAVNVSGQSRSLKMCPSCQKIHQRKSLHLRLDGNGDVIVSQKIYNRLMTVPDMAGMEVVNEVLNPPAIKIGAVPVEKQRVVEVPLNRDNASAQVIKPGATKYESEKRMWSSWMPLFHEALLIDDKKQAAKLREKRRMFVVSKKKVGE